MDISKFDVRKEDAVVISQIVTRASTDMFNHFNSDSKCKLFMDLSFVHNQYKLRLYDLLHADAVDFVHDIVGISNNLNQKIGKLENCFIPRFILYL